MRDFGPLYVRLGQTRRVGMLATLAACPRICYVQRELISRDRSSDVENDYQSSKVQAVRSLLDRDHRVSVLLLVQKISCLIRLP
jgi:hypothetical protein